MVEIYQRSAYSGMGADREVTGMHARSLGSPHLGPPQAVSPKLRVRGPGMFLARDLVAGKNTMDERELSLVLAPVGMTFALPRG